MTNGRDGASASLGYIGLQRRLQGKRRGKKTREMKEDDSSDNNYVVPQVFKVVCLCYAAMLHYLPNSLLLESACCIIRLVHVGQNWLALSVSGGGLMRRWTGTGTETATATITALTSRV